MIFRQDLFDVSYLNQKGAFLTLALSYTVKILQLEQLYPIQ